MNSLTPEEMHCKVINAVIQVLADANIDTTKAIQHCHGNGVVIIGSCGNELSEDFLCEDEAFRVLIETASESALKKAKTLIEEELAIEQEAKNGIH